MAHFAHYIKRTVTLLEKSPQEKRLEVVLPFIEHQPDNQGFDRPMYHYATRSSRAQAGDTFWLFSQLNTPWGALPPSLDARILIAKKSSVGEGQNRRIKFDACFNSEWFPIVDASELINKLHSISASGKTQKILSNSAQRLGQALRFPREIANHEELMEYSHKVAASPLDFISYRMLDGTRAAFELALSKIKAGRAVFWDRWSLPRRMSERGETLSVLELDRRIRREIIGSEMVFGVWSPTYAAAGTYSLLEKEFATSLGKFEINSGVHR